MAATYGIPVDHGYDRFRYGAYGLVQVKYIQTGYAVSIYVSAGTLYVLVAAGAKSLIAGTGEYDYPYVGAFTADSHCVQHLEIGLRTESIVDFRTVDGNLGHAVAVIEEYVFVLFYGFPVIHGYICLFGII